MNELCAQIACIDIFYHRIIYNKDGSVILIHVSITNLGLKNNGFILKDQ